MLQDIKYLSFLSTRLRNFKKKDSRLWNCSCSLCGDSQHNATKARGYFFPYKNRLVYKCHKCGVSMGFSNFLKTFDDNLYKEYTFERIGGATKKKDFVAPVVNVKKRLKRAHTSDILAHLTPVQKMPIKWQRYLVKRKIPMPMLRKYFYYTDAFKSVANDICPNTFSSKALRTEESRIVIPFLDKTGNVYCIQGRETTPSYAKYITIKKDEDTPKIFGLDRLDTSKEVVIVEGPIDSMFLNNALAVCGADLVSGSADIDADKIYCFDNEPRSAIARKKISSAIDKGLRVALLPVKQKDINDMVLAGHDVNTLIKQNTFSGLKAKLEFGKWSKR